MSGRQQRCCIYATLFVIVALYGLAGLGVALFLCLMDFVENRAGADHDG